MTARPGKDTRMRTEGAGAVNTEELRRLAAVIDNTSGGTCYTTGGTRPETFALAKAVPSLLDEIERLRRRAKSDSDGLKRWCDYQDRLFAVMTSDEIRAFDARLTEGGWSNESLCRHEAEVAALRRQIETALAALDQSDLFAPTAEYIEAAWALRAKIRAALSSVPGVPAARDDYSDLPPDTHIHEDLDYGEVIVPNSAGCHAIGVTPAARDEPEPTCEHGETEPHDTFTVHMWPPPARPVRCPGPVQVTTPEDPSRAACAALVGRGRDESRLSPLDTSAARDEPEPTGGGSGVTE